MSRDALYRTIWRWHFYAGLLVIPFIVVLSLTGAAYLFKPQVERWEERAWQGLPTMPAASPVAQRNAALAAFPGARFHSFRLPRQPGDAAMIHLALADGGGMRDVFVSPRGEVVGSLDPEARTMAVLRRIHGQLLLGRSGSWLVELAASWAIVMILTGLYLWWPRDRGPAGVIWPRLGHGRRTAWRDLHAVTGFWVSGLALILLLTGLPWADVWGSAFKAARTELGWVQGRQDWTVGGRAPAEDEHALHREHDHAAMAPGHTVSPAAVTLNDIARRARREALAFPVIVTPPGGRDSAWTVKSDAQNRPLRTTIRYDAGSGAELSREGFSDRHPIDRAIGYGIAWHEGQLFGWFNQLIGVLTAAMLIALAVSGFVLWRRRRPDGLLGAPPLSAEPRRIGGVTAIVLALAALLPLLAASLAAVWLAERLVLARVPATARWLGLRPALP